MVDVIVTPVIVSGPNLTSSHVKFELVQVPVMVAIVGFQVYVPLADRVVDWADTTDEKSAATTMPTLHINALAKLGLLATVRNLSIAPTKSLRDIDESAFLVKLMRWSIFHSRVI